MNDATRTGIPDDPAATRAFGDGGGSAPLIDSGYELGAEIGRGGMGVVYRATDRGLQREVAVKLLQDRYALDSGTAARFIDEARITGQLQHPGIPAVYQVGTWTDGRPFLAMKFINGNTLDELLKDGASATRWLGAFEGICHAVGYAHARGVIHRDLKPANVMVGAFGEVQVLDWGLAKDTRSAERGTRNEDPEEPLSSTPRSEFRVPNSEGVPRSHETQAGSVMGTPAFMPPEQAAGALDKIDARSDVFGLGAILCVLLTGEPPFGGSDAQSVWRAAARGQTAEALARLDGCGADPDVIALCKRCLALDPADRPADAAEVAKEVARLRSAADDRAKQAEFDRARSEVRAAEQRKRRRVIDLAAVALIAVTTAGVVVSLWQAKVAMREAFDAETARLNEEQQRKGAEEARATADRERAKAAARLDKAVEAVEKAVTRAGTARWARDPSLAVERRQILEDAVAFYEGFGEAGDPVVRRETAKAYRRIGGAYLLLADYPNAADYLGRARAICEALAAEFPDDPRSAADLAEVRLFAAHEAASAGRYTDAGAAYRDAAAVARRAAAARPNDDETRRTLVACLIGHGFFLMQTDLPAAGAVMREAVAEADGLLARPAVPFSSRALAAYTYAAGATFAFTERKVPDGIGLLKRAGATLAAGPPDPNAPAHYRDLSDMTAGILKMADGQLLAARPDQAAPHFRAAAETFDRLLAVYPKAFQYRMYQVLILGQEIQILNRLGRTEDAKRRRAELLAAGEVLRASAPNQPFAAQLIADQRLLDLLDRVRTGGVADLDREADDLLAAAGRDPTGAGLRYNVACVLSVGSRHGPPAAREARAARAVRLLTELLDGPFYRGPTNVAHIDSDTDLDPLRERADFRAFRAKLGPPTPAPAPRPKPEK